MHQHPRQRRPLALLPVLPRARPLPTSPASCSRLFTQVYDRSPPCRSRYQSWKCATDHRRGSPGTAPPAAAPRPPAHAATTPATSACPPARPARPRGTGSTCRRNVRAHTPSSRAACSCVRRFSDQWSSAPRTSSSASPAAAARFIRPPPEVPKADTLCARKTGQMMRSQQWLLGSFVPSMPPSCPATSRGSSCPLPTRGWSVGTFGHLPAPGSSRLSWSTPTSPGALG